MGKSSGQPTQSTAVTPPNLGAISNPGLNSGISVDTFPTPIQPAPTPSPAPAPMPAPAEAPTGPSIFKQSAQYLQQAGETYGNLADFQAPTMQAVERVGQPMQAGQIAGTDLGQYTSPYMQQVIDPVTQQIERQRMLAQEQLESQATRAKAFGARRDLERDRLAEQAMRQTALAVSPLYQQAYGQALGAAQFDIGQKRAADIANQQALEAAAAREQAARGANVESAFRAAGVQSGAAGGLSGLSGQAFGMGQAAQQAVQQQAMQQRILEQQILDAQRAQYQSQVGAPLAGLGLTSSILAGLPANQSTSYRPGLLDYVMAGSKLF